ncbi:hypothetical protein KUCAC02_036672, partial [Chaenocephalus aceratus]
DSLHQGFTNTRTDKPSCCTDEVQVGEQVASGFRQKHESEASEKNSPRSPKVIMSMNNSWKRSLFVKRRHATSVNRIECSPSAGHISMRALVSSELVSVFFGGVDEERRSDRESRLELLPNINM